MTPPVHVANYTHFTLQLHSLSYKAETHIPALGGARTATPAVAQHAAGFRGHVRLGHGLLEAGVQPRHAEAAGWRHRLE